MSKGLMLAILGFGMTVTASPVLGKTVEVKMLNRGTAGGFMVFEPNNVTISPGDTVSFVPTDKGHDVASLPDIAPVGAQPFTGKMSQPFTVKFTKEGLYGYKCSPHLTMGMVGLVRVGKPTNKVVALAAAAKLPPLARAKLVSLINTAK